MKSNQLWLALDPVFLTVGEKSSVRRRTCPPLRQQEKPRDNRDPGTMTSLSFSINYTVTIVGYAKGSIERGLLIDRGRMRIQQLCWRTLQFRRTHPGRECVGESGHL